MSCEDCEKRLETCEHEIVKINTNFENWKEEIKTLNNDSKEKSTEITRLIEQMKSLCDKIEKLTLKVDDISGKDGQKWNDTIKVIIAAVIGAILALVFKTIGLQ